MSTGENSGRRRTAILLACLLAVLAGCARIDFEATFADALAHAVAEPPDLPRAINGLEQCVDSRPDNLSARILLGILLHMDGRLTRAEDTLAEARIREPDDFFANYFYGFVLAEQGDFAGAIGPLEHAYTLRSQAPEMEHRLLLLLGRCCLEQKLQRGTRYMQVLRRFEQNVELHNALGLLWTYDGNYRAARDSFTSALQIDPENVAVLQNLAVLYDVYMNDPRRARGYYIRALAGLAAAGDENAGDSIRNRLRNLPANR